MALEIGVQAPAWHWPMDRAELRDWAQGVEAIGLQWIEVTDHVLYAYPLPDRPAEGPYPGGPIQHEALTTLAFFAAVTERVALQTAVLVLPQRQPLLVAKQAAEVDRLSGGRLRLGLGAGWQRAEYEALGIPFAERGARLDEAIGLLRACWTQEPVTFAGRFTTVRAMSMQPKPVTPGGPPLLFGGSARAAERRAARYGSGWIAGGRLPPDEFGRLVGRLRAEVAAAGRDVDAFSFQAGFSPSGDLAQLTQRMLAYRAQGADRFCLLLPSSDPAGKLPVDAHLRRLEAVWREAWAGVVG